MVEVCAGNQEPHFRARGGVVAAELERHLRLVHKLGDGPFRFG